VLTSTHVTEDLRRGEDHVVGNLDILHGFAVDSGKKASTLRCRMILFRTDE
jgi:hypothetical protein